MNNNTTRLIAVLATACVVLGTGCAASKPDVGAEPPKRTLAEVLPEGDKTLLSRTSDPWEGWNRRMYNFNARFDRYLMLPAAEFYKRYVPKFLRGNVHNFMRNIREVLNVGNGLLQFRFRTVGRSTGRFLVNSTLGMGGLLDPASEMGLYYQREDFGQTLGVWGVGHGPFMVLPIFGPSSVRDGIGLGVDWYGWQQLDLFGYVNWSNDQVLRWPTLLYAIDTRANVGFRYYEMGSIYEYLWVRELYLDMRQFEIER